MKKEQKSTKSLEKYFDIIFHNIAFSDDLRLTKGELRDLTHNAVSNRLLTDILKEMVTKDYLIRKKVKGKKGYVINEEISSGKMGESYTIVDVTKKGIPKYVKITQTELSRDIKTEMKHYKRKIANKKHEMNQPTKDGLEIFFIYHIKWITMCLSWITRLTLSIDGGIFRDKEKKIGLARNNILLIENFIQLLCSKIEERNPENYDLFLTFLHNYYETLDPFADTQYSTTTKKSSSSTR